MQHELGLAADEGARQLLEQSEGEVSPADKAAVMKAAVEKRVVALRMKMGKLVVCRTRSLPTVGFVSFVPSTFVHINLFSLS